MPTIGSAHSVGSNPRTVVDESEDDRTTTMGQRSHLRSGGLPSSFTSFGHLNSSSAKRRVAAVASQASIAARRSEHLHEQLEAYGSAGGLLGSNQLPGVMEGTEPADADGDDFVLGGGGRGIRDDASAAQSNVEANPSVAGSTELAALAFGEGNYDQLEELDAKAGAQVDTKRRRRAKEKLGAPQPQQHTPQTLGDILADSGGEADDEAGNANSDSDASDDSEVADIVEDFGDTKHGDSEEDEEEERPKSSLSRSFSKVLSRLSRRSPTKTRDDGASTARSIGVASVATPYRLSESESSHSSAGMSEDERAEKGMEKLHFKLFRDKKWHLLYLLVGVGLPGVLGFLMLGFLLERTSDFVRLEFGIYDFDTVRGLLLLGKRVSCAVHDRSCTCVCVCVTGVRVGHPRSRPLRREHCVAHRIRCCGPHACYHYFASC